MYNYGVEIQTFDLLKLLLSSNYRAIEIGLFLLHSYCNISISFAQNGSRSMSLIKREVTDLSNHLPLILFCRLERKKLRKLNLEQHVG